MLKDDLSLLVVCYDPYADSIPLNCYFLDKYWPNPEIDVFYVSSNSDDKLINSRYTHLKTNGDLSYSARLKLALESINTRYVLLLEEDYLLSSFVNEERLGEIVTFMKDNEANYCQLFSMFNSPRGTKNHQKKIIEVNTKTRYRINLQPSIYERNFLSGVVRNKIITPWDFELKLMKPEFKNIKAYYSYENPLSVINYIDKGKVTREALRVLKKNRLWCNQREVESIPSLIIKGIKRRLAPFLPKRLKNVIKRFLQKRGKKVFMDYE